MSTTTRLIAVMAMFLLAAWQQLRAQQYPINPIYYTIFDEDSLAGFNEAEARSLAIYEGSLGAEYKVKMYRMKRAYIDQKYNLSPLGKGARDHFFNSPAPSFAPVVPGCVNEDFEASAAGVITTSNQIAGWTIVEGYNGDVNAFSQPTLQAYYPNGLSGATSCNLTGCCPMPPAHSALIDCSAPGGFIDNTIGTQYPIFSVFGTGTVTGAAASNTQITQGMFGNKVIRLNDDQVFDFSMAKLSKTFSVSASNALFQFAFISVFAPNHNCCDAGAFQIKLYDNGANANGTPTIITCPNFSVSAPSSACTQTVPMDYYVVNSTTIYTPSPTFFNNIYNPWKISSMDLSSYIGKYITIEVVVSDCNQGGHFGYVYFDAQCGPMTVYGNGNPYDAGTNVVVPTCGAAGATICAADGLGPYSWAGIGLGPNHGVPSMTNQCITTTISTTFTLYMQPQGACTPISRIVQSTITPAPLLLISAQQAQCGSTLAVVNVTPSGSAMNPSALSWVPSPLSLNGSTTQGTYFVPLTGGGSPTLVSVTASDPLGCKVTATLNVNPAPPVPSFSIQNVTNSASITCNTPSVNLNVVSTYTYGSLNFLWQGASFSYSSNPVTVTQSGSIAVTINDPVTNCGSTQTISIGVNTVAPTSLASPMFQNITCANAAAANVTLTSLSTSVNITHLFTYSTGVTLSPQTQTTQVSVPFPGTYTYCLRNDENGCMSCKIITVTSSDFFPTYQLSSPQSFTLGCGSKSVATINIINPQGGNGGPVQAGWLPPGSTTQTPALSPSTTTNVIAPGIWTVVVQDNTSFCETRTPIPVISNTFAPHRAIAFERQILSCYHPTVSLVAVSQNTNASFEWNFPFAPGTLANDSLTVGTLSASPNNSVVGNFTLNVTDVGNACKSQTILTVQQNIYKPIASISGIKVLTCKEGTITLSNQSTTGIPTGVFPTNKPITGMWKAPSPQLPKDSSTSYVAGVPGEYTMTAIDLNNGCSSTTVFPVADGRIFPSLDSIGGSQLLCGASSGTVGFRSLDGVPDSKLDITWSPMEGTPNGAFNDKKKRIFTVNQVGNYQALVINIDNGCAKTVTTTIVPDSLTADFSVDQEMGFAPLLVKFTNTSFSSNQATATNSINSIWNFGNGSALKQKSDSFAIQPSVLFKQPGTYTVTLYINRGKCLEKVSKLIQVDIPSNLSIPNIFSPNGDGVNDLFFIKSSNLKELNALIYDRWGHLVYQLTSDKGQIAWDGKNLLGKDCAEGTYFYMIKATGADGNNFDEKGSINLVR